MEKQRVAVVVGLAVLFALAACNSATAGQPTTETGSTEEPAEETTSEPDYSLARLCELLTPDEAQQLGGSADGEKTNSVSDGHAICQWSDATTLVVGFQDGLTTANADTGRGITNTPTKVDGLPAVQSLQSDRFVVCEILVDLPSGRLFTSSASVLSAGEGKYDPCQVATELSNLIIPRVSDQ
ncbi:MAG: DUF3558 domain-containing protein [Actinophytocola sp.]|uniref:DUF3558 domain-containing protein n=1 Tax=Actinophytocola sp. TaxID=1872138 RepID=UPI003C722132